VFNVLLQILDDGRLTDSHGHVVNFKNTIIIMTSNIGSGLLTESTDANYERVRETVLRELPKHFRPEFLNRIDETVVFHALTEEHLVSIVSIQLTRFAERLTARQMGFEADQGACALLAKKGYDPVYGARPLKRVISRELETPVSRMIIRGELAEAQILTVSARDDALTFATEAYAEAAD
jgi:ATP-dependent Clp protease ATP-binding subunit ClpB